MSKLLLLIFFISFRGLAAPAVLSANVDKAKVKESEVVNFTITLDTEKGINLSIPEIGTRITAFRVTEFGEEPVKEEEGRVIKKRWYKLEGDVSGSYILPAVEIKYKTKEGKEETLKTSEIFVEVEGASSNVKDAKDIRDIKPLMKSKKHLSWLSIILLLIIILCTGGYLFLRYRKNKLLRNPVKILFPFEEAYLALERMIQEELLQKGEEKRFHFLLSEIIRQYFEGTYGLTVTDMTTEEVVSKIRKLESPDAQLKKEFVEVLKATDLVKFTDTVLGTDKSMQIHQSVRRFVDQTKPVTTTVIEAAVV